MDWPWPLFESTANSNQIFHQLPLLITQFGEVESDNPTLLAIQNLSLEKRVLLKKDYQTLFLYLILTIELTSSLVLGDKLLHVIDGSGGHRKNKVLLCL